MQANDPDRCQWVRPDGQCPNQAEDCAFCPTHSKGIKNKGLKHYIITNKLLGQSPERHNSVDEIKSLREEIALARALIETRLNLSKTETELVASMGILHQYLATVEKLVTACHRMDTSLGNLLSKAAIVALAQDLVTIIADELKDIPGRDAIVDQIASKLIQAIGEKDNG